VKLYCCDICSRSLKIGEVSTLLHDSATIHLCPKHTEAFKISLSLLRLGDEYLVDLEVLHKKYFREGNG
jgi:hypothetical protein